MAGDGRGRELGGRSCRGAGGQSLHGTRPEPGCSVITCWIEPVTAADVEHAATSGAAVGNPARRSALLRALADRLDVPVLYSRSRVLAVGAHCPDPLSSRWDERRLARKPVGQGRAGVVWTLDGGEIELGRRHECVVRIHVRRHRGRCLRCAPATREDVPRRRRSTRFLVPRFRCSAAPMDSVTRAAPDGDDVRPARAVSAC